MQVLTPEQAKLMWSAFDEVAKWCVTAITLWLLGSLRKSYKALQHTLGVLRGLPAQFEAHRQGKNTATPGNPMQSWT